MSRYTKILKIAQAHLLPGMSLVKWKAIINQYQIRDLNNVPDQTLDDILQEIDHETQNIPNESNLLILRKTHQNRMVLQPRHDTRLLPGLSDQPEIVDPPIDKPIQEELI